METDRASPDERAHEEHKASESGDVSTPQQPSEAELHEFVVQARTEG